MDISRNSVKSREWIEKHYLPAGWIIGQDGTGRYVKVTDTKDHNRTMYHAGAWRELSAWCEGVGLGMDANKRAGIKPKNAKAVKVLLANALDLFEDGANR